MSSSRILHQQHMISGTHLPDVVGVTRSIGQRLLGPLRSQVIHLPAPHNPSHNIRYVVLCGIIVLVSFPLGCFSFLFTLFVLLF